MALSGVIRRAASRVVPLSIRASTQRYIHQTTTATSTLFATKNCPNCCNCAKCAPFLRSFPSFGKNFSTNAVKTSSDESAVRVKSDESLLRVIESEIQCAVEGQADDDEVAEEIPEGFPFEIEDKAGQQTVTLTREYIGETITVEVHMPDVVTGEEDEVEQDDNEDGGSRSSLPLVVRISKKTGPALEFGCTAYPDEIAIDSLSVRDPESSEDQIAYEGPDFLDLDENLQKAFHKYLEIRGIKPSTTNFLHGFMVEKDAREYITWLKNLQQFVKA